MAKNKEEEKGITIDNFEDGQYGMDNNCYSDEDDDFLEAELEKTLQRAKEGKE